MQIHVVKKGEYVYRIARDYGVPMDEIIYANQLEYPYGLAVGQAILIPDGMRERSGNVTGGGIRPERPGNAAGAGTGPERPGNVSGTVQGGRRTIEAGGYAYPFINPDVLAQTLPYLSRLYVFSYGFTEEGELLPPAVSDTRMLTAAGESGVAPVLTLTPSGADGSFDNNRIRVVVNDPQRKQRLIGEVVETVQKKGFRGVDLDFEYIRRQDREAYAVFTSEMREAVNAIGYPVSVALAPKTSDDQQGLLYEGKDYALLGAAADQVLLMTYEWGYTYGEPMAVAPLDQVRRVVEYAISRIPPEKICLGIPNYGYDWTLPYVRGSSKAENIGNIGAMRRAVEYGAAIEFDERAQSPFFKYYRNGKEHEVWFEDVRSLNAKYSLLEEYGLRGIGCWQIMRLFRACWLLLEDRFTIQ